MLYASSQRIGCFIETPPRLRPDRELFAELGDIEGEDDFNPPGAVPLAWLEPRLMGRAQAHGRFADVCDEEWTQRLRASIAPDCVGDAEFIRSVTLGTDRRLTQLISAIVYASTPQYAGIRYPSRYDHPANIENWALFEPFSISDTENETDQPTGPGSLPRARIFKSANALAPRHGQLAPRHGQSRSRLRVSGLVMRDLARGT